VAKLRPPEDGNYRPLIPPRGSPVTLTSWKATPVLRARPRARGPVKSELQQAWIYSFIEAACLSKGPDPLAYDAANFWADDTGWYYRDVIERAMAGKLIYREGETHIRTPTVNVSRSSAETIPTSTFTDLSPNTKLWDTNSFWAPTTPKILVVRSPGLYSFGYNVEWSSNGTGTRYHRILLNGATPLLIETNQPSGSGYAGQFSASGLYYFHALDYITLNVHCAVANQTCKVLNFWMLAITPEGLIP